MPDILRRLFLGCFLITAGAAILLVSDKTGRKPKLPQVALFQHVSQTILEEGAEGVITGLAAAGYVDGETIELRRYNAEGEAGTSNTIARDITSGPAAILITLSTPSLQAVANANRATRKNHVFALVTDPASTGVGISRTEPLDHPAWLAGYGTLQPVEKAFKIAQEIRPSLKKVGILTNAAETNSEAQLAIARRVCGELGIELSEMTVENSAGVAEATGALTSRGVEAIFLPGDVTVLVAADTLVATAGKAGIPVFSVIPPNVKRGVLFDIGANYTEVGFAAGKLAAEILKGRSPASVEIVNYVPEFFAVNEQAAARFPGWTIPPEMIARAQLVIRADGTTRESPKPTPRQAKRSAPANVQLLFYMESIPVEQGLAGFRRGATQWGMEEGRDYNLHIRNAQGDIAALNALVDAAVSENPDVVVPFSTPALQAVAKKAKDHSIVFGLVANPVAAGVVKSSTDKPANITGITVPAPAAEMLDLLQKYYPQIQRIGSLYCPAEANSVDLRDMLLEEAAKRGIAVETIAVATAGELPDAAMALVARPIDAIVQISDNLSTSGFPAITRAARQVGKPLFSLNSTTMPFGAAVVLGRDYESAGEDTAELVGKVLQGASPASLAIVASPQLISGANLSNAKALGLFLPPEMLRGLTIVEDK